MDDQYKVTSEADLELIIGPPMDVKAKIATRLDPHMKAFIERSPLVFISTIDDGGFIDISPKGDPCGFISVDSDGNLLIPDRPGNRLLMGFRNLLRNPQIGLIFVIPNQRETLRVKGVATIYNDPAVLTTLQVNQKPALLCTYVQVHACFMHCGKAMVRSKLWQPDSWGPSTPSIGARQLAPVLGGGDSEIAVKASKEILENAYRDELY